jgi:hypothetical protein
MYLTYYVYLVGIERSDWPNEKSLLFLCRSIRKLFTYRAESFRNPLIVWGDFVYFPVLCAIGMKT